MFIGTHFFFMLFETNFVFLCYLGIHRLFIQQKMKISSHTAEFKLLAFSAVRASMLELDLLAYGKICIFVVWLGILDFKF